MPVHYVEQLLGVRWFQALPRQQCDHQRVDDQPQQRLLEATLGQFQEFCRQFNKIHGGKIGRLGLICKVAIQDIWRSQ